MKSGKRENLNAEQPEKAAELQVEAGLFKKGSSRFLSARFTWSLETERLTSRDAG